MGSSRARKRSKRSVGDDRYQILLVFALFMGVVVLASSVMVASPRHRAFYLGFFQRESTPVSSPMQEPFAVPSSVPLTSDREPSSEAIISSETQAVTIGEFKLRIIERPSKLPLQGAPPRWAIKTFAGQPQVDTMVEDQRLAVRLVSRQSSFALYRDVTVNLNELPVLSWSWKVVKLPKGGDVRRSATDDQAAQVYVVFPRWPYPKTSSEVIGYIWDGRAPAGLTLRSPRADNVRLIVLQSGQEKLGRWVEEARNIAQDYRILFGKEPPIIGRIAVMVDSNDTRSEAEAWFHDLAFFNPDRRQSKAAEPRTVQ